MALRVGRVQAEPLHLGPDFEREDHPPAGVLAPLVVEAADGDLVAVGRGRPRRVVDRVEPAVHPSTGDTPRAARAYLGGETAR